MTVWLSEQLNFTFDGVRSDRTKCGYLFIRNSLIGETTQNIVLAIHIWGFSLSSSSSVGGGCSAVTALCYHRRVIEIRECKANKYKWNE